MVAVEESFSSHEYSDALPSSWHTSHHADRRRFPRRNDAHNFECLDHVNLRELVNISFVPLRHPRGTGFIGWDLVDSCDLAYAANSTLRSKHAHVRFLLDWGGAQIGNKIEGNMENSNSAIQFSVFLFGIARRIRSCQGAAS